MRFRDWPPRRIGLLWLAGAVMQAIIVVFGLPMLGWEPADKAEFAMGTSLTDSAELPAIHVAPNTTPVRPLRVTRTEIASGDTLVRLARDSSWVQFRTRGGTVQMSPDVERAAGQITKSLTSILLEIGWALLQLLLLTFTVPVLLVATTLAWLILRRPPARPSVDQGP